MGYLSLSCRPYRRLNTDMAEKPEGRSWVSEGNGRGEVMAPASHGGSIFRQVTDEDMHAAWIGRVPMGPFMISYPNNALHITRLLRHVWASNQRTWSLRSNVVARSGSQSEFDRARSRSSTLTICMLQRLWGHWRRERMKIIELRSRFAHGISCDTNGIKFMSISGELHNALTVNFQETCCNQLNVTGNWFRLCGSN